jgi:hypothetical protein
MLRCVTARAGSVLDDGPLLAEKRKPQSSNSSRSGGNPHAPLQGVHDVKSPHDNAMSKPAGGYKPPLNPAALAITASSVPGPPPAPPVQVLYAVYECLAPTHDIHEYLMAEHNTLAKHLSRSWYVRHTVNECDLLQSGCILPGRLYALHQTE